MRWQFHYKIEGVYEDIHTKEMYVPIDVVNHTYNTITNLHEFMNDPLVIYRHLDMNVKEHKRYAISLSQFHETFKKV